MRRHHYAADRSFDDSLSAPTDLVASVMSSRYMVQFCHCYLKRAMDLVSCRRNISQSLSVELWVRISSPGVHNFPTTELTVA